MPAPITVMGVHPTPTWAEMEPRTVPITFKVGEDIIRFGGSCIVKGSTALDGAAVAAVGEAGAATAEAARAAVTKRATLENIFRKEG